MKGFPVNSVHVNQTPVYPLDGVEDGLNLLACEMNQAKESRSLLKKLIGIFGLAKQKTIENPLIKQAMVKIKMAEQYVFQKKKYFAKIQYRGAYELLEKTSCWALLKEVRTRLNELEGIHS